MTAKNLEELIQKHLGSGNKLISYDYTNLLPSGENYGSVLLNVRIKYETIRGEEHTTSWVAKIAPPVPFLWDFFNTAVTFKKEVGVYKDIAADLNEFGNEKGIPKLIDIFADYHGSRLSLNPNATEVDVDAVLLLENLNISGYECKDRFVGFDFDCTKLILTEIAILHASIIAFKLARPEEFRTKIRRHLDRDFFFNAGEDQLKNFFDTLKGEAAAANPDCVQYFPILERKLKGITESYSTPLNPKEPFASFVHGDLWVNNVLLKFENGIPVKHKMVDFQIIEYNSPANDVLFLLYSSVELSVLRKCVDEFLKIYHDSFVDTLKKLDCDLAPFSYQAFLNECERSAKELQFAHLVFMHIPMFTQKGEAKKMDEFGSWVTDDIEANRKRMHPICGKRLQFIIMDFAKRGWI